MINNNRYDIYCYVFIIASIMYAFWEKFFKWIWSPIQLLSLNHQRKKNVKKRQDHNTGVCILSGRWGYRQKIKLWGVSENLEKIMKYNVLWALSLSSTTRTWLEENCEEFLRTWRKLWNIMCYELCAWVLC